MSPATSTRPQSLSMFVVDLPSSGTAELVQNLFRIWTAGLKMDLYEQSSTQDDKTIKTVLEDWELATWRGATGGISYCSLVPNLQYPWPCNLAEGDLWLEHLFGTWCMGHDSCGGLYCRNIRTLKQLRQKCVAREKALASYCSLVAQHLSFLVFQKDKKRSCSFNFLPLKSQKQQCKTTHMSGKKPFQPLTPL